MSRGSLVVQVLRQYANCALRPLMRVVIKPDASQKLDGYHTISNFTDELILEHTTLFCRKGYDSICSSSCDCLQLGYKERHVFSKKVDPRALIDCMFLTNWPYSHPPIDDSHNPSVAVINKEPPCQQQQQQKPCWCRDNVKFIRQHSFDHSFSLPPPSTT